MFAELNKGEAVTAGLRKVKKEEMTHKNPALRVQGPVPGRPTSPGPAPASGKKPLKPSKPTALAGKKPSKLALEGKKWVVVSRKISLAVFCSPDAYPPTRNFTKMTRALSSKKQRRINLSTSTAARTLSFK